MAEQATLLQFSRVEDGIALWIHVPPRARRAGVGGVHGGALRVAVREAPSAGAANSACEKLLAKALRVARDCVDLPPHSKNRRKRVQIRGDPDVLAARLMELAAGKVTD